MSDIGNEITLSLPRNGSAGMTGPLMLLGNATAPLEAVTLQQLTSMTAGYLPLTGGTLTGDLTLSGNGRRIKGDFSNANVADRLAFQTNVANGDTILAIIPNGTSAASRYDVYNGSDIANAGQFRFQATSTSMRIAAEKTGTGAYQPIEFLTSSLARLTIGVDGNITAAGTMTYKAPSSYGQGAGGQSIPANVQTQIINYTNVIQTSDNPFNATTGEFTAPVAGYYSVNTWLSCGQFAAKSVTTLLKSGGNVFATQSLNAKDQTNGETYLAVSASSVTRLSAGSKVTAWAQIGWTDGAAHPNTDGAGSLTISFLHP